MKAILSLVAVMSLAACGTAKNDDSQASGFPGFNRPQPVSDDVLIFARDGRPVDGALDVVTLNRTEEGKYDLTHRHAFVSRMTGESSDKTEELAYGMDCTERFGNYTCSVDHRPVDGALLVLSIEQGTFGYSATLTSTYVSRQTGEDIVTTQELGGSLEQVLPAIDANIPPVN